MSYNNRSIVEALHSYFNARIVLPKQYNVVNYPNPSLRERKGFYENFLNYVEYWEKSKYKKELTVKLFERELILFCKMKNIQLKLVESTDQFFGAEIVNGELIPAKCYEFFLKDFKIYSPVKKIDAFEKEYNQHYKDKGDYSGISNIEREMESIQTKDIEEETKKFIDELPF
ncbi:MAG: hypothetical protein ACOCV1_04625 [Bacillota bacterium]